MPARGSPHRWPRAPLLALAPLTLADAGTFRVEDLGAYARFALAWVVFAIVVWWVDTRIRRRAAAARRTAARELEAGRTEPFEFDEERFRGFTPACPAAEEIFARSFAPDERALLKVWEPDDVTEVRIISPCKPTYGFGPLSSYRRLRVLGGGLKLAMKGRGAKTCIVRRGYVSDGARALDVSGMIASYRPGKSHLRLYRYYASELVPVETLFEWIDHVELLQRSRRLAVERLVADGGWFDLDRENLFGLDLSGLDLSRLRSLEGSDLRFVDLTGTKLPAALAHLRKAGIDGTDFKKTEFAEEPTGPARATAVSSLRET